MSYLSENDYLITPSQAAAMLGVTPRTLWRWQAGGRITPQRLPNGFRRFRLDDVERLVGDRVA